MDIYASDEEKGEDIKRWWRENGQSVIVGFVLGAVVIFGGRYWIDYKQMQAEKASVTYQHVSQAVQQKKVDVAKELTQTLFSDYSKTPYAIFAAFTMAAQAVNDGDSESAKLYLQWISDHASLSGHLELARLRLAKLLVDEQQYQQALALTEQSTSASFSSLFAELRGDIFIAMQNKPDARSAYQVAINNLEAGAPRAAILQVKLDDLAVENDG
ncbi:MAG: tetratricopeptide repeat protein [Gammaproteobacteria bacterium]|nr:tetratricopeptide repeat protein [Gammaproteobacteria bacterium]